MDFSYDEEQNSLRDAVRGLVKSYDGGVERRREVTGADPGFDTALWGRMAEMGLLGLPFAEDDGGMGAGPIEVAIVAEELGRVLAPEPFVAAVAYAGNLVALAGSAEQRAGLLGGLAQGSLLLSAARGPVAEVVIQGAAADRIIWQIGEELFVSARPDDAEAYRTHDGGRGARLAFDPAAATPLGSGGPASEAIARARALGQVAACAEALGAMETALKMTTDFLTTRKQFGVTLNRFQSLTFRAADMYTDLELTRSMVGWATMVAAEVRETPAVVQAAARAKLQTIRAARRIGQEAIQLHGGIGMTAEYAVGHYTSRLTALAHWLGDDREQLDLLISGLGDHGVLDPLEV